MKRIFSIVDESLPPRAWKEFENEKQLIRRANKLETKCDQMFNHFSRSFYGKNAEIKDVTKNVRIFIRHQFFPKSIPQEKDYYLLTIEGHILDPEYRKTVPFVTLFDRLTIDVGRRGGHSETFRYPFEDESNKSISNNAYSFTAKIVSDSSKGVNAHIRFDRNVDVSSNSNVRYEISDHFLSIFPNILLLQNKSVSEKEILFTVWYYITEHGLVDLDRRCVRCDQALVSLFGLGQNDEAIAMHSIKHRLIQQKRIFRIGLRTEATASQAACDNETKPSSDLSVNPEEQSVVFNVDYLLNSISTNIDVSSDTCCTPSAFIKGGGKCFDIEMTLPKCYIDVHALQTIKLINELTGSNNATSVNTMLEKRYQECLYISKNINKIVQELEQLDRTEQHTVKQSLFPNASKNNDAKDEKTLDSKLVQMMYNSTDTLRSMKPINEPSIALMNATSRVMDPSILHTAHGYVDIGDDLQFNAYYNHVTSK